MPPLDRLARLALLAIVPLLALTACDDDSDATSDGALLDAELDADLRPDASTSIDAAPDLDAAPDPDATPDAALDPDADPDAALDPDAYTRPPLEGPLGDYVATPDDAYAWEVIDTESTATYTAWKLRVDSQNWRTLDDVDRTLWTHGVSVLAPKNADTTTALLVISGGDNDDVDDELAGGDLTLMFTLAAQVRAPVILLEQTPNQPLSFAGTEGDYTEDTLVAYTWRRCIDTGDGTWPAYLPMVKGTVRAMDAIQEHADATPELAVDDFIITGFSKRGATAWLTAAVDDRVRAVAPGVFDILHMEEQIDRHYGAYGFYAPAIDDYVEQRVIEALGTPGADLLVDIVDPIAYLDRFIMPKLVLTAGGDEFFLPDAATLYLDELPGETLYRQFPNTGHSLDEALADVIATITAWFRMVVERTPRPTLTATRDGDTLIITADPLPTAARLWTATNPDARDFRFADVGDIWTSTDLDIPPDGILRVPLAAPIEGFTAHMVDVTFEINGRRQTYGTPSHVLPDIFPFIDEIP